MLVFTFLLYGGYKQVMLVFLCFLLLVVFIFAWYLGFWLYPDFSEASCYGITELLKISSEEDNDESRDLIEIGSCLITDVGLLVLYLCI